MKHKYYSLEKEGKTATLNIYGDITSYGDGVGVKKLSKELDAMKDVSTINVYINSYGGEVAEGLAIYNALRRHKAKIKTYCDGFACSSASVIFMAGEERIMYESSLLMIHNAWSLVMGNANELRKQADDLEKITQASVEAYKAHSSLEEDEIKKLMDEETWILPEEAIEYGFATSIEKTEENEKASQCARLQIFNLVKAHQETVDEEDEKDVDDVDNDVDETEPTDDESNDDESQEPTEEPDTDEDNSDDTDETDGDETTEDESETEDNSDDDKDEEAAQKMCGFFNAILKM
jgi:ATP-dependent Clp protease protease subunit